MKSSWRKSNSNKITFINVLGVDEKYKPIPSKLDIPKWYKELESYMNGSKKPVGDGTTAETIKKCIPVFDAITAGYIIPLPSDLFISSQDDKPYYEWASLDLITFHSNKQALTHPAGNSFDYPKLSNPWGIKTPSGYSSLFVQPFHRESRFTILPGVVDTDTYTAPVNFPFVLNDPKWEGLIPAGTPMVQVIPFKRQSWEMEIGSSKDLEEQNKVTNLLKSVFFDRYKNLFWHRKEYK